MVQGSGSKVEGWRLRVGRGQPL